MTDGLEAVPDGPRGLAIRREGRTRKWVSRVAQLTFNGRFARARGQEAMYVIERAVFRLADSGIVLTEIAPGVDLERDVLRQIEFPVEVSEAIRPMDARLFDPAPMGLRAGFRARGRRGAAG